MPVISIPTFLTIKFTVDFTSEDMTAVDIHYEVFDPDKVINPNTFCLLYGTKSATHSVLLKRDPNTKQVNIELPFLEDDDDPVITGTLSVTGLAADTNYQFSLGYEITFIGDQEAVKKTYNFTEAIALKTGGTGEADKAFASMRLEINSRSTSINEIAITNIKSDPIVKIAAGHNITCVLTKSGKLFTWGATRSDDNRLGETIQNNIPIIDFKNSRLHITVLREDNSVAVYGPRVNALALNLDDKYPLLKLGYEERLREILIQTAEIESKIEQLNPADLDYNKNKTNLEKQLALLQEQNIFIEKVVTTSHNALVLTADNDLRIWGNPVYPIVFIPSEIKQGEIADIFTGLDHAVVLTKDGKVYAWGNNDLKQINVPKNTKGVTNVFVNCFQNYAVADGKIIAWGNSGYIFGTDSQGRPLLHRIIIGGRVSMLVGLIATEITLILGVIAGLVSGFYGGWVDMLIMRIGEVVNSFPFLPLAITLSFVIGNKMESDVKMYMIMVILGVLSWPGLARLVRGQILSEREKDFVIAARALGIKETNIITRHILPNVINIIIVDATLSYAGFLLTEAGLSFLGFGVMPPKPSWGNLLTSAQDITVITNYWWQWIIPALFIVITALSINLIGDALREAMDPKANER